MNDGRESAFWLKNFFRVCLGFGLGNHLFNHPVFVHDKRGAVRAIVFAPHEFFQPPHAIGVVDMQFFVAQQVELKPKLVDELEVRFGGVLAHAQHLVARLGERGEVALVEVDNVLYALGGERPIEGSCNEGFEVDPGEQTVGTDEVEVLLPDEGAWSIISGFPEHTFRFAAAAGSDGLIYAFGGQSVFDTACDCQRTSDEIRVFDSESVDDAVEAGEGGASEDSENSASNPALSPVGIATAILASVFMM